MQPTHDPEDGGRARRPHRPELEPSGAPDFLPMRLVLQPSGSVVEVSRPDVVIGRHTEADVRLPLPDVSRRHCRLQFVEGCWQVIDLQSLNGVFVNGEQVLQAPLEHGDLLRLGGFTFSVDLTAAGAAKPVPETSGHVQSILKTLAQPSDAPRRKAS